ncbi:MAG: hypothetical protein A2076_05915 [Geobacteraceae bacterium GWC2_53_11]|nr:MAG: hypothetical protein A2076_05915 [Geobacteraceae bacterium GWC2_53_11]
MSDLIRTIGTVNRFRADILAKYAETPLLQHSLSDIKRVVIINSSSRSGSSLLYSLLSKLPQVYALTGEAAPFYKLNSDHHRFDPYASDKIADGLLDEVVDYAGLSRDFLSDLFLAETETVTSRIDAGRYIDDLQLRLSLQWPDIVNDASMLRECVTGAFQEYAERNRTFAVEEFYLHLLERLASVWPQINPFYYDISTDRVALRFPYTELPAGPPDSRFTVEEPPFILLPPRRRPSPNDLAGKILLLKSTVDCYRMNLVERLFPAADIRIIHLQRNPAATINGIYDGWLHRGFFSHNLQPHFDSGSDIKELRIKGYSELYPFGRDWWNFDLPEGWQAVADRELVDVCAFQWRSANTEILRYLEVNRRSSCAVHFEDIIRGAESRLSEFERLLDFMGVPPEQCAALPLNALPVVQSTLPPQLYRWKRREDMIGRVLDAPHIREMAEMLGYRSDSREGWL